VREYFKIYIWWLKGGSAMTEEKLLDMWQNITGYVQDW